MSNQDLIECVERMKREQAKADQEKELMRQALEIFEKNQRRSICNFNDGDSLRGLSNYEIGELVRKNMPSHTYDFIDVREQNYCFEVNSKEIPVRKIEIKRIHLNRIIDAPTAFFSTLFKSDSLYVQNFSGPSIAAYLLAPHTLDAKQKEASQKEIKAAYLQYKFIHMYVPEDCGCSVKVEIYNGSEIMHLSVERAKFLRDLFKKL